MFEAQASARALSASHFVVCALKGNFMRGSFSNESRSGPIGNEPR